MRSGAISKQLRALVSVSPATCSQNNLSSTQAVFALMITALAGAMLGGPIGKKYRELLTTMPDGHPKVDEAKQMVRVSSAFSECQTCLAHQGWCPVAPPTYPSSAHLWHSFQTPTCPWLTLSVAALQSFLASLGASVAFGVIGGQASWRSLGRPCFVPMEIVVNSQQPVKQLLPNRRQPCNC
jgi:hypothetical protein